MKLRFFSSPARDPGSFGEELNRLLRGYQSRVVQRELMHAENGGASWAVCVEYLPAAIAEGKNGGSGTGKPKVDSRQVLNKADFAIFDTRIPAEEVAGNAEALAPIPVA